MFLIKFQDEELFVISQNNWFLPRYRPFKFADQGSPFLLTRQETVASSSQLAGGRVHSLTVGTFSTAIALTLNLNVRYLDNNRLFCEMTKNFSFWNLMRNTVFSALTVIPKHPVYVFYIIILSWSAYIEGIFSNISKFSAPLFQNWKLKYKLVFSFYFGLEVEEKNIVAASEVFFNALCFILVWKVYLKTSIWSTPKKLLNFILLFIFSCLILIQACIQLCNNFANGVGTNTRTLMTGLKFGITSSGTQKNRESWNS